MYFFRRYIERRLEANEEAESRRRELRMQRMRIEDELHHCYGRMFFWIHRFVLTGEHNGELEAAFTHLEDVEAKKKELDRSIIADAGIE